MNQPNNHDLQEVSIDRALLHEILTFGTREIQYQRRARLIGLFIKPLFFIGLLAIVYILGDKQTASDGEREMDPHIAVVNVYGPIASSGASDADKLVPAFKKAMENPLAKALVLRINSPGGSPVQADRMYAEIIALRAAHPDKKIYAVIEDLGASAAYYIASAADEILVNKSSMVGSIGVITSGFGFTELMNRVGVERRVMTAGENKALLDPFQPLQPNVEKYWKGLLAEVHTHFIDAVKEGRGERLNLETEGLFSGLIWSGSKSIEIGLADRIGSAGDISRELVGDTNLVDYTPMPSFVKKLGLATSEALYQMAAELEQPRLQ